ncbi:hypothetical protein Ga0466249_005339 [Sporomusaceae bacterium BoRhaA]|uniref:hypothetical protein n=1 Tax=Pelorhabdus rhamnosifermentans TaxID=2772457 RepID=UPI001C061668|nr:hypothetical protein [Pelorhabdus rhamnosifermentans]MBU2704185.1 hypothetical protein [Pelorhabdus rhamnosifermentans]
MIISVELNEKDTARVQKLIDTDVFNPGSLPRITAKEVVDWAVKIGLQGLLEKAERRRNT